MRTASYVFLSIAAGLAMPAVYLLVNGASNPPDEVGVIMAGLTMALGGLVGFVAFACLVVGGVLLCNAPPLDPRPGVAGERK